MTLNIHTRHQIESLTIGRGHSAGLNPERVLTEPNTLQLIVGLGGSGCDMLREVKGLIQKTCRDDNNPPTDPRRVIYLGIDTDLTDDGALKSTWTCSDGTQVCLNSQGFASETLELPTRIIPPMPTPHTMEWLDIDAGNHPIGGRDGAHGIRQVGRLSLFVSMQEVLAKLTTIYHSVAAHNFISKVNVFLLSGISGGTGSGIFLDMAYILRKKLLELTGPHCATRLFGYLAMPDVNEQRFFGARDYLASNGYAALQELEHLMNLSKTGARFQQVYLPGVFEVDTQDPPFDHVHLICHNDGTSPMTADWYHRTVATAARSILSFVARETPNPALPSHSMEAHYSNVNVLVNTAMANTIAFPERSYGYKALGISEFALPQDDINKYILTLLFGGMNSLFDRQPGENDAQDLMDRLSLSAHRWIPFISSRIPQPFPVSHNDRTVFAAQRQAEHQDRYNHELQNAILAMNHMAEEFEKNLQFHIRDILSTCFTDLNRGPIWVSRLITNHLIPCFDQHRYKFTERIRDLQSLIVDAQKAREREASRVLLRNPDRYMEQWNLQFRAELEIIALNILCKDYADQPSIITQAIRHLHDLNCQVFGVSANILTELMAVASRNTDIISWNTPAPVTSMASFILEPVILPQLKKIIDLQFQALPLSDLVHRFLQELLSETTLWIQNSVDVIRFLDRFLDNHLRPAISIDPETCLTDFFVATGMYPNLHTALASSGGLFDIMTTLAKPRFLSHKIYPSTFVLTVPANSPNIVAAANSYCWMHNIALQLSSVPSRICLQSVACCIPLMDYLPIHYLESSYCHSPRHAQSGRHLRAYRLLPGQTEAPAGIEDWHDLPSVIPARSRIPQMTYPESVRIQEGKRRDLFRRLTEVSAIRFRENIFDPNDLDCSLHRSNPLFQSRILELLGDGDRNLKRGGKYSPELVHHAVTVLNDFRIHGLPATEVDPPAQTLDVLRQCWKYADQVEANRYRITDPARYQRLKEAACRQIAEEFFVASLPLYLLAMQEDAKYRVLFTHLERLDSILCELEKQNAAPNSAQDSDFED